MRGNSSKSSPSQDYRGDKVGVVREALLDRQRAEAGRVRPVRARRAPVPEATNQAQANSTDVNQAQVKRRELVMPSDCKNQSASSKHGHCEEYVPRRVGMV